MQTRLFCEFMRYGQDESRLGGSCARRCRATVESLRIEEQTRAKCYAWTHKEQVSGGQGPGAGIRGWVSRVVMSV